MNRTIAVALAVLVASSGVAQAEPSSCDGGPPNELSTLRVVTEALDETRGLEPTWERAAAAIDKVVFVAGLAVGAASIAGTGGIAVPIAASALIAWRAYRSIARLHDRIARGRTLHPLRSAPARADWIGLLSNVVGIAAIAAGGPGAAVAASLSAGRLSVATLAETVLRASGLQQAARATSALSAVNFVRDRWFHGRRGRKPAVGAPAR